MSITGTFVYSFDYTSESYVTSSRSGVLKNLPFVTTNSCMVIDSSSCVLSSGTAKVSVTYTFTDNGSTNDGLRFYSVYSYYNDSSISNLQITSFSNVPLARNGSAFKELTKLTSINTSDTPTILSNTSFYSFAESCTSLTDANISDWDVSNVTTMSFAFLYCRKLTSVGSLSNWNVSNVKSFESTFNNCSLLTEIGNLSNWNVSNVTNMNSVFNSCKMTSVGSLLNWDVSKVTNFNAAFYGCSNLTSLDMSDWDVSSGIDFGNFFNMCFVITSVGDLSNWNVSTMNNSSYMFSYCFQLTTIGNVYDNWDVTSVTNKNGFSENSGLSGTSIPNWDGTTTTTTLDAPTIGSVSSIATTTATLSFTAPSGAESGTTYVAKSGGTTYGTASYPATSFSLTGLLAGTSYSFTITATNTAGTSSASSSTTFTTILSAPTIGKATAILKGSAKLSFTAPSGVTYIASAGGISYGEASYPAKSISLSGLSGGTTYSFAITATNTGGTSGASSSVSFKTVSPSSKASRFGGGMKPKKNKL